MDALAALFMMVSEDLPPPGWPAPGCYAAEFDAAHLAANPDQTVRTMHLSVSLGPVASFHALVSVTLADQGRAAAEGVGGRALEQGFFCDGERGAVLCETECPGDGAFTITRDDGDVLEIVTDRLPVGPRSACPLAFDIAGTPGTPVSFRLSRVPDADCSGP